MSALADVADENELKTGMRQEGIYYSARAFFGKASNAFGHVVAGWALKYIGFPENAIHLSPPSLQTISAGSRHLDSGCAMIPHRWRSLLRFLKLSVLVLSVTACLETSDDDSGHPHRSSDSGAQGEYTGLLVIKAYQEETEEDFVDVMKETDAQKILTQSKYRPRSR